MRVSGLFLLVATTAATLSTGCGDDTVTVEHADVWGHRSGRRKTVTLEANGVVEAAAIVGSGARAKRIAGRIGGNGVVTFEDLSASSYVLELRYAASTEDEWDLPSVVQYPIDGADRVRIGSDHWAHPDGELLDDATSLTLNLTAPLGLKDGDVLDLVSLGSSFFVGIGLDEANPEFMNAPPSGATMANGFVVPATELDPYYGQDGLHLPSEARDDELTLVHQRAGQEFLGEDVRSPWRQTFVTRAIGVATLPKATLTNGGENAVTATLAAPTTGTIMLDYRASTLNGIDRSPDPSRARAWTTLSFRQEVGTGPGYYASPAVLSWSLSASMRRPPANPDCFPGPTGTCSPSCGTCDTTISSVDPFVLPGDIRASLVLPTVYESGMRGVVTAQYSVSNTFWHPVSSCSANYTATATVVRPASALSGPIARELASPMNPKLDGESWILEAEPYRVASETPTLTFEGPAADYFVVTVIELCPDDVNGETGPRTTRTVATLYTRSTSVVLPPRVLQPERYYVLRISARRETIDFATPGVSRSDTYDATDLVTAPFSFF